MIVERHGVIGRGKHHRSRDQVFWRRPRKILRTWGALGDGYVVTIPGRGYQFVAKVAVISDPEASNAHGGVRADLETVLSNMRAAR
jgi:hypothetical protein